MRVKGEFIRVERKHIIDPVVPSVQQKGFTCGPAVVQAILAKYGRDVEQSDIERESGCTENGTVETGLVYALRHYGLTASVQDRVSVETLYEEVLRDNSVILCITAWGTGHWVALIGQSRRNWYFADPSAEGGLGYIKKSEFYPRWYNRRGIVVSGVPRRNAMTTLPFQRIPE